MSRWPILINNVFDAKSQVQWSHTVDIVHGTAIKERLSNVLQGDQEAPIIGEYIRAFCDFRPSDTC